MMITFLIIYCSELSTPVLHPITVNTWCGYEVLRMILLHDLNGAMCLDCSKDIPVHVLTCTTYDFNTLTTVVWKLWSW